MTLRLFLICCHARWLTFEREENESFDVLGMTNTTPLNATLKSDKFNHFVLRNSHRPILDRKAKYRQTLLPSKGHVYQNCIFQLFWFKDVYLTIDWRIPFESVERGKKTWRRLIFSVYTSTGSTC